jgi:hypothetical protein
MDLGITSGLAALLEEQRRKRELEALRQQEVVAQEPAATSPVLTPEVSTNGAPTPAPAGDGPVAGFSGSSSPGNREPRNTTGGLVSTRQGVGYGMSAAAEEARGLGDTYVAAAKEAAGPDTSGVAAAQGAAGPDISGLTPIQGSGNVRPARLSDETPDPNFNVSAAIADQAGLGGKRRAVGETVNRLNAIEGTGPNNPVVVRPTEQAEFDVERDAHNRFIGNIGASLAKAGVAPVAPVTPPPAPADPLAPKPKLTARQRAEAEVPARFLLRSQRFRGS